MQLQTNEEFQKVLSDTRSVMQDLMAETPDYPVYYNIAGQLAAIFKFTENGRIPTKEERESINFGIVVVRELEPDPDPGIQSLVKKLHALSYYFDNLKT